MTLDPQTDTIEIHIGDWHAEVVADAGLVDSVAALRRMVDAGTSTVKLAKRALVSRQLGVAPATILRPNKALLLAGAQADVARRHVRAIMHAVALPNGCLVSGHAYIGTPSGNGHLISGDDAAARQAAWYYLVKVVPGHIWRHLVAYIDNGGDPEDVFTALCTALGEMAARVASLHGEPQSNRLCSAARATRVEATHVQSL